jgi:putative redox protein
MMKMTLKSTGSELDYMGFNEKGHGIRLNGNGDGVSPMQSVLLAVAACSSIDVEIFLKKMRNDLTRIEVDVEGDRAEDQLPKVFTAIRLHYKLYGDIKEKSAQKSVDMAVKKYCSVSRMLEATVDVSYTYEIIAE